MKGRLGLDRGLDRALERTRMKSKKEKGKRGGVVRRKKITGERK
jgi:hypothetical protein